MRYSSCFALRRKSPTSSLRFSTGAATRDEVSEPSRSRRPCAPYVSTDPGRFLESLRPGWTG